MNEEQNTMPEITLIKPQNTVLTLNTENTFVDKNLQFKLNVRESNFSVSTTTESSIISSEQSNGSTNIIDSVGQKSSTQPIDGYYIKVKSQAESIPVVETSGWIDSASSDAAEEVSYYPIDAANVSVQGNNIITPVASVVGNNVTLSVVDNGISILATGGGTAQASVSATNATAGYVTSGIIDTEAINAQQTTTTANAFISEVSLQTPQNGTRLFSVTVPNNDTIVTFMFSVDSNGNVTVE